MTEGLVSDPRRDATASIRGYVYQAYQSVWAWMRLRADELLFLEGAEDFDLCSDLQAVATQVKDHGGRSVTLRSADAVEAVDNYWAHRGHNKDRRIRLRFLTTAERGHETGSPLDRCGIDYWEAAVQGKVSVGPLRAFLQVIPYTEGIRDFLAAGTDQELVSDLLSRIEWDTGNRPLQALKAMIEDDLVSFGAERGINSHDSAKVLDSLFAHVADVLSSKGTKRLAYADFSRSFDASTTEMMPRGQAAALRTALLASVTDGARDASAEVLQGPLPLVRGAVARTELVDELASALAKNRVLLLWGSTGLGKTSLALLVTTRIQAPFAWAGFRGQDAQLISQRLGRATSELKRRSTAPNVVLDDLDLGGLSGFERELLSLAFYVRQSSGHLVITGYIPCPGEVLEQLWLPADCDRKVPYLGESDVADILRAHGATDEKYVATQSKLVLAVTSGHPQLVHARVRRLASENWPHPRAESLFSDGGAADVKDRARRRLVEELPSNSTRELAYRLSLAMGSFSRGHALAVAEVSPRVSLPGESLDLLIGPWLERVGNDAFQVSPLLRNAGVEALSVDDVRSVHAALALYPLSQGSVSPSDVGSALLHGLVAQSEQALVAIAQLLLKTPARHMGRLAESLFVFPEMALAKEQRLCKANPSLDLLLRVVQFKTAAALGRNRNAVDVIERALEVLEEVPEEVRSHTAALAYGAFLSDITVPIPPSRSIPMLAAFMRLAETNADVASLVRNFGAKRLAGRQMSPFQAAFQFEAARMAGITSLESILLELGRLSEADRSHLLQVCEDAGIASLLVNNAWLRDVQAKRLDPEFAVRVCEKARDYARAWGSSPLARAASVAVSVLHDEYRHDPGAALEELARAGAEFGMTDGRVLVGRAKVLHGMQNFTAAIEAFEYGLKDDTVDGVDRVFAMRLFGVSVAKTGDWARAANVFLEAADVAGQHQRTLNRMGIGLRADAAFARWKQRDVPGALRLCSQVLGELDSVSIDRDLRSRYLHATVRHMIVWVWAYESERKPPSDMVEPPAGMCSNQDPHEGIADFEIRDIEAVWELLAATDDRSDAGLGIRALAAARTARKAKSVILQAIERSAALDGLRRGKDLGRAVQILLRVLEAVAAQRKSAGEGNVWVEVEIGPLPAGYWDDAAQRTWLSRQLVAVGIVALATGVQRFPLDAWKDDLQAAGALRDEVARVATRMGDGNDNPGEALMEHAAAALARLAQGELLPKDRFQCHFRLLNWVCQPRSIHGEPDTRWAGSLSVLTDPG